MSLAEATCRSPTDRAHFRVHGTPVRPDLQHSVLRVARWNGPIPPTPYGYHGGTTGAGPRAAAIGAARAMTRLSGAETRWNKPGGAGSSFVW